jgi:ABC-type multidrug transport system permease subunit
MLNSSANIRLSDKREEALMDENNSINKPEDDNIDQLQNESQSEPEEQEQEQVQIPKELLQKPETPEHNQPKEQQYQQQVKSPETELEKPVGVGEWMLTTLVMMIPLVNIIMMFVWAFSSKTKKSKSNYFKATLIWMLIWIGVIAVISIALVIVGIIIYSTQL